MIRMIWLVEKRKRSWPINIDENVAQIILLAQNNDVPLDRQQFKTLDLKWHQFNWKSLTEALELLTSKKVKKMVLGDSNFYFRFRSIIQFLPLWYMDDKAEAEIKTALAKYHQNKVINHVIGYVSCELLSGSAPRRHGHTTIATVSQTQHGFYHG